MALFYVPMGCLDLVNEFPAFPNAERNGIAAVPNSVPKVIISLFLVLLHPAIPLDLLHLSESSNDVEYLRPSPGQMSTDMVRNNDKRENLVFSPNAGLFNKLGLDQVFKTLLLKKII